MKKILFFGLLTISSFANEFINSIEFEGLHYLSKQAATEISGLKIKDKIDNNKLNSAIKKLFSQNYFEDIKINVNDNGDVLIKLKEKPSIAKLELNGVVNNDKSAIQTLINIKTGSLYDDIAINEAKQRINKYYEAKGYLDTVIDIDKKIINKNAIFLTLNINRGENLIIKKINLIGAKKLRYSNIESGVANKSAEFLGWFWGRNDGKAQLFELENDNSRIKDQYYQRGFLDAEVSPAFLSADFKTYTANIDYYVKEGKIYKLNNVDIQAPNFLKLNKKKILSSLKSKKGTVVNSQKIRQDIENLQELMGNMGYAFAKIDPQTKKEDGKADIKFVIEPNEKVYIRNIIISGNDRTIDKVIRRELYLTEGQLFNQTDFNDSKDALLRTGYFDDIQIIPNRAEKDQIDLLIKVKEASTGSINGGLGYGTADGLLINGSILDRNIFGSGTEAGISINRSNQDLDASIFLNNPRIFDSLFSLSNRFYINNQKRKRINYKASSIGFSSNIGRKFLRNFYANTGYGLEISKKNINNSKDEKNVKSTISLGLNYNSTDDFYLPRRGIYTGINNDFAGIGGDEKFIKTNFYFNYYLGLKEYVSYDLIFRAKINFGKIIDLGKVSIDEKFFLGGIGTIRGYEQRSITPKDIFGNEIGGDVFANGSLELSFPLINRVKMRGLIFTDYGTIGDKLDNQNNKPIKRGSYGLGIEWITPIGPLQVVYAKPIGTNKDDKNINRFEFSVGRRF